MYCSVSSVRVACDGTDPAVWTRGRQHYLERDTLRAVRSSAQQALTVNSMIADALAQGGRLIDLGYQAPEVLQYTMRSLCWGLIRTTPVAAAAAAMNTSQWIVRIEQSRKYENPERNKSQQKQGFSRVAKTLAPWQSLSRFDRGQGPRRLPLTEAPHAGHTRTTKLATLV